MRDSFRLETLKGDVSAAWHDGGKRASALVVAHGAGAGMNHPFITGFCDELAAAGVSALRFNFPYLEAGRKSPGSPKDATAAVVAAVGAGTAPTRGPRAGGRARRGGPGLRGAHRSHRRPAGVRRRQELRRSDGLDGRRRRYAGRRPRVPRIPAARPRPSGSTPRRAPLWARGPDAVPPRDEGSVR